MEDFRFSENLIRLRHEKKLTQDDVAAFVGVTKASVSKWENKQCMPDISILPILATIFDVSIDELLGYQPQLGDEQIRKLYHRLAEGFVHESFEKAFLEVSKQVKTYYNCFPFVLYMCVLMLNHYMLAGDENMQDSVLQKVQTWCVHICDNCKEPNVVEDAYAVRTMIDYLQKKYTDVIEALREKVNPLRMSGVNNQLLIQTYASLGDVENTEKYTQTVLYTSISNIVSASTLLLAVLMENREWCRDTIDKLKLLDQAYHLEDVNLNLAVQCNYQIAINLASYGEIEAAYPYLERFVELGMILVNHPEKQFSFSTYFERMREWMEQSMLGSLLPRDKSFITSDIAMMLEHPLLQVLQGESRYERLKKKVKEDF
ncbi:MAG: helix-turn-helix domain-containing protein [Wujia sp.]